MEGRRVLVTGIAGVGKTAVITALRERDFRAIDMDEPGWAFVDEQGHQRWHLARLLPVIDEPRTQPLFVSGCSEDQVALYPRFSRIVLLSAPPAVIAQRLASRTGNPYGKDPAELAAVMRSLEEIEPLLRARATHEIVTTRPIEQVVDELAAIARG